MGRWDGRPTRDFDKFKPDDKVLDDWNKEFNNNFDWKETPWAMHPKNCNCPKHEYFEEQRKNIKTLPIIYKYCPDHFKVWHETKNEMMSRLSWLQRQLVKFMLWRKLVVVQELTYAQSALCIWCKFGSGGRGIKNTPDNTIAPHQ